MKKLKSGFTLIELLVVIAIVSLLSSIVLASVRDTRVKASNAAINRAVLQYANALELYRMQNNTYPYYAAQAGPACLGTGHTNGWCHYCPTGGPCSFLEVPGSPPNITGTRTTDLKNKLASYLPSFPVTSNKILKNAYTNGTVYDYQGAMYYYDPDPNFNNRYVFWMLEGVNTPCARLPNASSVVNVTNYFGGGNTRCLSNLPL